MKKIDGLVKLKTVDHFAFNTNIKKHYYEYKGVVIARTYSQGTVGRVGLKRSSCQYKTAGYRNGFSVETWNEAQNVSDSFYFTEKTLQQAIETIEKMITVQKAFVKNGKLYRNFPQEKLQTI